MTFPTLTVVSPHTKGPDVKDAEYLLAGNGRFREHYYGGVVDGEFGPLAGAASARAKYWTGYKRSEIDHVFGPKLYSYLLPLTSGKAQKLPLANRLRRKYRLSIKPKPTPGELALAYAAQFVGYHESPGNNNIFGAFFGINFNPWCGCFISYCYTKVGHHMFWPYVPTLVHSAEQGWGGLYVVSVPRPGDLVCFDWGDGQWDHVELVEKFDGTTINTLGGNTLPPGGVGNQGNGGGVYRNARSASIRHVFIRVKG